jgi:hypothetical protein
MSYLNIENTLYFVWGTVLKYTNNLKINNSEVVTIKNNSQKTKNGHIQLIKSYNVNLLFNKKNILGKIFLKKNNFIALDNNYYLNKISNSNIFNFDYKNWGKEFGDLNSKFENNTNKLANSKIKFSILNKNIKNINLGSSTNTVINKNNQLEEILQRLEQLFLVYLGNNYMREVIYSHYGS